MPVIGDLVNITVVEVRPKANSSKGEKRYVLFEDEKNYCIFVEHENRPCPKVGDRVIAHWREVTPTGKEPAQNWYYFKPFSPSIIEGMAQRDTKLMVAIEQHKYIERELGPNGPSVVSRLLGR